MTDMINVGERKMQEQWRVLAGKTTCEEHGIEIGDPVEVWLKKVKKEVD